MTTEFLYEIARILIRIPVANLHGIGMTFLNDIRKESSLDLRHKKEWQFKSLEALALPIALKNYNTTSYFNFDPHFIW